MKLTVNRTGVYLDDQPIQRCTSIELKNIGYTSDYMEAVLHVDISEADIQWKLKEPTE